MESSVITKERFSVIIDSIPANANSIGFTRNNIFFNCSREINGTSKGTPYSKPEHIQINANKIIFWIDAYSGHDAH
jgi:hypothetical protein